MTLVYAVKYSVLVPCPVNMEREFVLQSRNKQNCI